MQLANYAHINDTRVDRMERGLHTVMGLLRRMTIGILQHMPMGVVFIMDATGQRHPVPMYMAGSFDVRRCGSCR